MLGLLVASSFWMGVWRYYQKHTRWSFKTRQEDPKCPIHSGRRRKSVSKGKAKLPPGRPKGMKVATYPPSRYNMPTRKQAPGKRMHSLKNSIQQGTQNAGKW